MLGRQRPGQRERVVVERVLDQLVAVGVLRQHRLADGLPWELHGSHRGRVPVELQRLVDRLEHAADRCAVLGHDHRADVGPSRDHALSDAGQLAHALGVHAEAPRAVLARHLPHARVDPEPPQRAGDQLRALLEARVDAAARVRVGHSMRQLERPLVEDRGTPAGEPEHGAEPGGAGRRHGVRISRGERVALGERHHPGGARQAQGLGQLTCRDAPHGRPRDRRVEGRVVREGVEEDAQAQ